VLEGLGKGGGRECATERGIIAEDPVDETELGGLHGFLQQCDVLFQVWKNGGKREGGRARWVGSVRVAVPDTESA